MTVVGVTHDASQLSSDAALVQRVHRRLVAESGDGPPLAGDALRADGCSTCFAVRSPSSRPRGCSGCSCS